MHATGERGYRRWGCRRDRSLLLGPAGHDLDALEVVGEADGFGADAGIVLRQGGAFQLAAYLAQAVEAERAAIAFQVVADAVDALVVAAFKGDANTVQIGS